MTTRTWLAKSRTLAARAYHRTVGEVIQRRRSRAYTAREHAAGRTVTPLAPRMPGPAAAARSTPARAPQRTSPARIRGRNTR